MNTSVQLPKWLDNLIFEQLGAKYCRSNADMTVIDWDKNDVLNYLGTYFPRSYAESYCIFSEFLTKWPNRFVNKTELSVFDFGCGTGGEIIGLLDSLQDVHSIQMVRICALDGNYSGLLLMTGKSRRDSVDALREYVFIDSSISRVVPIMCSISTKMAFSISHRSFVCLIKKN